MQFMGEHNDTSTCFRTGASVACRRRCLAVFRFLGLLPNTFILARPRESYAIARQRREACSVRRQYCSWCPKSPAHRAQDVGVTLEIIRGHLSHDVVCTIHSYGIMMLLKAPKRLHEDSERLEYTKQMSL